MTSSQSQSYHPFLKNVEDCPSRSLNASIWAPQPQPNESWPRTIASFSRAAEDDKQKNAFGPVGFIGSCHKKDIGAIGDGRRKNSSDMEHIHVEQLLRTLNLNSPAPFSQPPPLTVHANNSPDLSPSSATSALLTPTDLSPAKGIDLKLNNYEYHSSAPSPQGLMLDPGPPHRAGEIYPSHHSHPVQPANAFQQTATTFPFFEPFSEASAQNPSAQVFSSAQHHLVNRSDPRPFVNSTWRSERELSSEWLRPDDIRDRSSGLVTDEHSMRPIAFQNNFPHLPSNQVQAPVNEPINFLSLLHPSSSPPYHLFVSRIIKSSDQQASIFLQQKLKVADLEERAKIIDAICAKGFEMMAHRFGNWAVQRCLEAASTADERRKIVHCMRGRVVDLASNCYGCHVLQKALDCEEDVRLLIVSELLLGDPAQTLVNKHASHVWSKIMELTWTAPAPPIFAYVNKSLKGKWASLACHETGSLVVQHAFENLEESAKDGIIDELLNQGTAVFSEVAKNQWGSYCIQHILEHGSADHRRMALDHIVAGLLEYATNEQGSKSVTKALKEGGKETLDRVVKRMAESSKGGRRAIIVDLALSVTGSQLIAAVLPNVDKDQRSLLYDSIRGHIVTLRGCKTGSKVIWLFDRMRAYYGY